MLVVTHEMGFARRAANRVVFMDDGEIVEDAPPDTVLHRTRAANAPRTSSPRSSRTDPFRLRRCPSMKLRHARGGAARRRPRPRRLRPGGQSRRGERPAAHARPPPPASPSGGLPDVRRDAAARHACVIGVKVDQPCSGSKDATTASTAASTSRSPSWSPPSSASAPTRSTTRRCRRPTARTRSSTRRDRLLRRHLHDQRQAQAAGVASPGRTTSPARTCWCARTTPRSPARTRSRARRSAR